MMTQSFALRHSCCWCLTALFLLRNALITKSINIKSFQPVLMTTFTALRSYIWRDTACISEHPSHVQLGLMVLPPAHNYYIGCAATTRYTPKGLLLWMSAVIYNKISIKNISSIDSQTKEKISLAPTPFSDETSLLYNL
jgi:hypothetical protein